MKKSKIKKCKNCKKLLPLSSYSKNSKSADGLGYICKDCDHVNSRRYYWSHKDERLKATHKYMREHPEAYRNSRYRLRYGITIEDYNVLWNKQGGVCIICGKEEMRYNQLVIDHNHETGEIRGLICSKCNNALGCVGDSIKVLQSMILYLERVGQK